jgi:glutaredoxin 3
MLGSAMMAKVEVYTKMFCPYCSRAKNLLESKGVDFEEIDITMGGPKRKEMLERAPNHTTVPSIFIDGAHIGGSDDLAALDAAGKLDPLLAA